MFDLRDATTVVDERIPTGEEIDTFATALDGTLIRPGDPDYEEARAVWNGVIDRRPALIARCATVDDVVRAVRFAREHELLVAVRGGGHSVAGHGTVDGGMVIDLSPMKQIDVDPVARITRAQGGTTWGELDAATQVYGLATPGGVVSDTGIAGLTLGGGYGWLRNKYGLAADNLIGAEVVTADGRVIHASDIEHSELMWGLRGGGGNFGIVTTFEYRLHPVGPDVAFTFVFHDGAGDNMHRALRFYRDYSTTAPDEVSTLAFCGIIPPEPQVFPEAIHGRPYVAFGALYAGPIADGQRIMQPLLDFGEPLLDHSGVVSYVEAQRILDEDYPSGMRYYWKSLNLRRLDDEVIDRIVWHARRQPSPYSTTDLWHIGGAVTRPPVDSAFYGRHAAFLLSPEANWVDPEDDEENIAWLRTFVDDMQEFSDGSRYLNFPGFQEEGEKMMRAAFGERYKRLVGLKNKYDPTNFFRLNQNITPTV